VSGLITLDLTVWRERCRGDRDTGRRDHQEARTSVEAAPELVRLARDQGLSLTCPDGPARQGTGRPVPRSRPRVLKLPQGKTYRG
jgi:hypothetical protein